MLRGELYRGDDPELVEERRRAQALWSEDNALSPDAGERRRAVLESLFGSLGCGVVVEAPFRCDYGYTIAVGVRTFINYSAVVLDCAPVIGREVQPDPTCRS